MTRLPPRSLAVLRWVTAAALVLLAGAGMGPARGQTGRGQQPAAPVSAQPSSIEETYGDWRVLCRKPAASAAGGAASAPQSSAGSDRLACVVAQQQLDDRSKRRVVTMELHRPTADRADGVLILPFGVALAQGVTLQLDGAPPVGPLRFRTCLPVGCVAPIAFDARFIAFLRKGQTLALTMAAEDGKALTIKLPLKGLGAAIDRAVALSR